MTKFFDFPKHEVVVQVMCGILYVTCMIALGVIATIFAFFTPILVIGMEWIRIRRGGESRFPIEYFNRQLKLGAVTGLSTIIIVSIVMIIYGHNPLYPIIPIESFLPR